MLVMVRNEPSLLCAVRDAVSVLLNNSQVLCLTQGCERRPPGGQSTLLKVFWRDYELKRKNETFLTKPRGLHCPTLSGLESFGQIIFE